MSDQSSHSAPEAGLTSRQRLAWRLRRATWGGRDAHGGVPFDQKDAWRAGYDEARHQLWRALDAVDMPGGVLAEVADERARQHARWGEQNHPDGTAKYGYIEQQAAEGARAVCQLAAEQGVVTWRHILAEEVAEAFAEKDPTLLRTELLQVAAVAVAWAEAIDRREADRG